MKIKNWILYLVIVILVILLFKSFNNDSDVKTENERIVKRAYNEYLNGEDYWDSVEANYKSVDENHVYWVANGKSFHSTKYCVALRNSSYINEGTLKEAFSLGKVDPCSKCVGD